MIGNVGSNRHRQRIIGAVEQVRLPVDSAIGADPLADPFRRGPVKAAGDSNDAGDLLTGTTFIQRINTQGGTQPPAASARRRRRTR
jgi:hypothetical protein